MKIVNHHKLLLTAIGLLISVFAVVTTIFYNNQFYAQKVLSAIEQDDTKKLKELMNEPMGNLNCKPTLWLFEVMGETNHPTPLQAACKAGNPEIVEILIENGANVNYTHWDQSRDQGSPLMNAAGSPSDKRLQVIQLLVENGADIDYVDAAGNDALSCALFASFERNDTIEIIEYLEKEGLDIYKSYSGSENTLLHKACECDDLATIKYLIEQKGFDVNAVNANGDTTLIYFMRFASKRKEETLLYLIQMGADPKVKNNEGKSAYDYADERHPEFLEILNV